MIGTREVTNTKTGAKCVYKYNLTCGSCSGTLQFRVDQGGDRCVLKYGPKFVVENDSVRRMLGVEVISAIPHTNMLTANAINMGVPFIFSYPKEPISDAVRDLMSKVRYNCIIGDSKIEKK